MDVILMGTACAQSGVDRDNTYLLLRENKGCTLVDVGGNPLGKLKKMNVGLDQVKRVVFTHFHIDHIYGLPSLLWGMWIEGRTEPLDLYCTQTEKEWLEAWIEQMGTAKWPAAFAIRIHTFDWESKTLIWREEDSWLSIFPSKHGVPAVGVEYVCQGKVMVYSSDTIVNSEILQFPHIDLLIHEATQASLNTQSHSSLQSIAEFYNWDVIQHAILVHLMDGEPYEEVWQGLPEHIRSKISIGEDLMIYTL